MLDTGEVLWRRNPERTLPIASVTKMMTALVAVDALKPRDKARITKAVLAYSGSGVGVLPRNKRVRVETLLTGSCCRRATTRRGRSRSARPAAIEGFVRRMNERAGAMGLKCTQFAASRG